MTTSKTGVVNNLIQVSSTDFEVFDALRIDSQDSADLSGTDPSQEGLQSLDPAQTHWRTESVTPCGCPLSKRSLSF